MSKFVLDANIFVEAYKRYYSFDIAPAFWHVLKQKAEDHQLISIDRIYREISQADDEDELKIWATSEFYEYFKSTEYEEVINAYREIILIGQLIKNSFLMQLRVNLQWWQIVG